MQTQEMIAESCKPDQLKTMQAQVAQAEHLWHEDILRRLAAHRSGVEPGIPAEEVLGHL